MNVPHHPDGETCADCRHIKRCSWLLSYTGTETQCDWTPSKFQPKPPAQGSPLVKGGGR